MGLRSRAFRIRRLVHQAVAQRFQLQKCIFDIWCPLKVLGFEGDSTGIKRSGLLQGAYDLCL